MQLASLAQVAQVECAAHVGTLAHGDEREIT